MLLTSYFRLLSRYYWLLSLYFWLFNRYCLLLRVTSGYLWLLLVDSDSSFYEQQNYITSDNYVARNNCKTEVNSESGKKSQGSFFLSPDTQFIMDNQNRYPHKIYGKNERCLRDLCRMIMYMT